MRTSVLILMGSDSDWDVMRQAYDACTEFGVTVRAEVSSAHRSLERTLTLVREADQSGTEVFIVGAGAAAHLAGVVAAATVKPVIGVPLAATDLNGLDALLSTVQMPGGIPIATMAIGKAGAKNAALFAVSLLALHDEALMARLRAHRAEMAAGVAEKSRKLQEKIGDIR